MKEWALVFIGGGLGSMARYGLSGVILRLVSQSQSMPMPWGTLVCNVGASALLGGLAGAASRGLPQSAWLLLAIGICGGWSTFSSFSMDTVLLFRAGRMAQAVAYMAGSAALCLAAFWLPFALLERR